MMFCRELNNTKNPSQLTNVSVVCGAVVKVVCRAVSKLSRSYHNIQIKVTTSALTLKLKLKNL